VNSQREDDEQDSLFHHPVDGEEEDDHVHLKDGSHDYELPDRRKHYLGGVYMLAIEVCGLVMAR